MINKKLFLSCILIIVLGMAPMMVHSITETATLSPASGSILTKILLQVRGLDSYLVGNNFPATTAFQMNVYWDDISIGQQIGDLMGPGYLGGYNHLHIFDYTFSPPNQAPYSNIGDHNVRVEMWENEHFLTSFNLKFTITTYIPPTDLFLQWWESLDPQTRSQLQGPQGPQGPKGATGSQGVQGPPGKDADMNFVYAALGISIFSLIIAVYAVSNSGRRYR